MSEDGVNALSAPPLAVVLDANCMPRGRLNLDHIIDLLRVIEDQELDTEVWVPEPVVLEWAEHLHQDVAVARASYKTSLRRAADAYGEIFLFEDDAYDDINVVVSGLIEALEDCGVKVLEMSRYPAAASEGLRDQVLQIGVGRRKVESGERRVKTGASDSTSFRLVEASAGEQIDRIILVSEDKDVGRHEWSSSAPEVIGSIREMKDRLLKMLTGSERMREEVRRVIISELTDGTRRLLPSASIEGASSAFDSDYFDETRYLTNDIYAEEVEEVQSVDDLEVSKSEAYASATVRATIELRLEAAQWNQMTDRLDLDFDQAFGVAADLQVSAHLDDGYWKLGVEHIVIRS